TPDSTAWLWLTTEVRRIADRIVEEREAALRTALRPPARHLPEEEPAAVEAAETERQETAEETLSLQLEDAGPMPARTRAEEIRDSVRASMSDAADAPDAIGEAPSRSTADAD
ncbi:MAG TPA: hypothetical protein VFX74_06870, partial [Candidatus Limnocylindria bacterium]|nr:hypothetical protein [Candidatus Limnocylindria bacterium]